MLGKAVLGVASFLGFGRGPYIAAEAFSGGFRATFLMGASSILDWDSIIMAVSGLWMLIVFYGVVYALLNGFSTDFFILLGIGGALAFVLSS